jgi:hypothetical protein
MSENNKLTRPLSEREQATKRLLSRLKLDPSTYKNISLSPEQTQKLSRFMTNLSTGSAAALPLLCAGPRCQPPGTRITTTNRGEVTIETLDPDKDLLWVWDHNQDTIRTRGYPFTLHERDFSGHLIKLTTLSGLSHCVTPDHLSIAHWTEKAKTAFCVYLMEKDGMFRVGKTQLFKKSSQRFRFGLGERARAEKADKLWILFVCDTNTEALLKEEYFSVAWGIPKALFVATDQNRIRAKQNGLYAWVTQEELTNHHKSLQRDLSYYVECLNSIGLLYQYPHWSRGSVCKNGYHSFLQIYACNLIPLYMELPCVPAKSQKDWFANWETLETKINVSYTGKVYSLGVKKYETYIANQIITHNCPFCDTCPLHEMGQAPIGESCLIEVKLLQLWRESFVLEYDIDPESMTELFLINELAEVELMLYRLNKNLSKPENATLVQDEVVAVDREGNTLTKRAVSAFLAAKEALINRRNRVVKLMVGDRQEKYKRDSALKLRTENDPSQSTAELRRELQSLIASAKNQSLLEAAQIEVLSSSSGPRKEESTSSDEEPLSKVLRPVAPEDLIASFSSGPKEEEKKE